MTHLPWIAASYGLAAALVAWLVVGARLRLVRVRRRLRAVDPRFEARFEARLVDGPA